MASPNPPSRHEASILAAGLAVAGTAFMSDKLSSLARHGALASEVVLQVAAVALVTVGVCLLVVEWPARAAGRPIRGRGDLNSKGNSS